MLQSSSSPFLSRQHWVRRMWTPIKMGMMKKLIKDGKGAPWRLAGGRSLKQQFSHDETGWYADIPLWPGPRGACAMVCGADTLLDLLAGENERISLRLSLEPQHLRGGNAVSGVLDYVRPDGLGDGDEGCGPAQLRRGSGQWVLCPTAAACTAAACTAAACTAAACTAV